MAGDFRYSLKLFKKPVNYTDLHSEPISRFLFMAGFFFLFSQLHSQRSCDNIWWDNKLRSFYDIDGNQEYFDSLKANLPFAKQCKNWRGVVGILNGFAFHYHYSGNFDSAKYYSEKSIEIVEREIAQLDTTFFAINAFNDAGALQYYYTGDTDQRIDYLERAAQGIEKLVRTNGNQSTLDLYLEITFHNLAATYAQLGDYNEAIRLYRRVITLKEQLLDPEPSYLAPSYAELGKIYLEMGDFRKAGSWYQKALDAIPKTDPAFLRRGPGYLLQLAKIDLELDNAEQALANLRFARSLDSTSFRIDYDYLMGKISLHKNKPGQALPFFEKALSEAKNDPIGKQKLIAELHGMLAQSFMQMGAAEEAIRVLNAGLGFLAGETNVPEELSYFPAKDSVIFPFEVVKLLEQKANIAQSMVEGLGKVSSEEIQTHNSKAYALALELCQEQIASFRADDSKLFWVDKMSSLVHRQIGLQTTAFQQSRDSQALAIAFQTAELLKAAVLREAIFDARAISQAAVPQYFSDRLGALKFECVKLKRKLDKSTNDSVLQRQLFTAERNLELLQDSVFDLVKESSIGSGLYKQPGIQAVQQALDSHAQLIQFSWSDEQLVIFSIHQDRADLFTIDAVASVTKNVELFSGQLQKPEDGSSEELAASGQALFEHLLKPLGPLKEKLVIVPDGPLFNIPFAALIDGETKGLSITEWPWLIKEHSISYSSSSSLFLQKEVIRYSKSKKWLGVAPVRFGNGLSSLPLSGQELERVEEAMGDQGRILEGTDAYKTAFLDVIRQNYSFIHFSTHASSNGNFPGDSWLAFAGDGDSARLFLDELYALPLKTQLVVLSACETQSGKLNKNEGIMSLARAFRYAGSESVLATLWPSDELASSLVLEQFYKALSMGSSKDEALKQAQLHYLLEAGLPEDKMHPAYWAPFVLTGDMAPLKTGPGFSWLLLLLLPVLVLGVYFFFRSKKQE